MDGIITTPLRVIEGDLGNVMHGLRNSEDSFNGFGEVYFSTVNYKAVKGWKKHHKMISNLIVVEGEVRFVFYDDRQESKSFGEFYEVVLSPQNYNRLTIHPGIWMAFEGISDGVNLLMNFASIEHDPKEADVLPLKNDLFEYQF